MAYGAAVAVAMTAPPPARPAARAPTDDSEDISFDQRLEAAREDAATVVAPNEGDEPPPTETDAEAKVDTSDATAMPAPAQPSPTPVVAPMVLQLVSTSEGEPAQETPLSVDPMEDVQASDTPASVPQPLLDAAMESIAPTKELMPPIAEAIAEQPLQTQNTPSLAPPSAPPAIAQQTIVADGADAALAQAATAPITAPQGADAALAAPSAPQPRVRTPTGDKIETQIRAGRTDTVEAKAFKQAVMQKQQANAPSTAAVADASAQPASALPEPPPQSGTGQLGTLSSAPTQAGQAQHAILEQSTSRAAPASAQVAREIVRKFDGGNTRFELRLDPPELGRIEVRLDVSRDHRVTAVVAADSPQALAELVRHARDLEQTLQSAGLELSDNGLSFDLRQDGDSTEHANDAARANGGVAAHIDEAPAEGTTPARPIGYERWRGLRVDMMV